MDNGFILLSRGILDSDVFASQKLLKIWIWCLCKANFKDKTVPLKFGKGEQIIKVKRGSFIFGRNKAEEELFIDGSTIYKSMQKLKQMEMIEIESNNQYSIVTICKYNDYQDAKEYKVTSKEQVKDNQVTSKEQVSNTTNNYNNYNNDNKEKNNIPTFSDFLIYGKEKEPSICDKGLKLKYDSWVENDWKDGNNSKITNWKVKLLNTLAYLPKVQKTIPLDHYITKTGELKRRVS
jgi:hypothetical protein